MYTFMSLSIPHDCWCPERTEECVRSPGAAVTGSCELCDVYTRASARAISALKHWDNSPALKYIYSYRLFFKEVIQECDLTMWRKNNKNILGRRR